jgi:hypothetical protein
MEELDDIAKSKLSVSQSAPIGCRAPHLVIWMICGHLAMAHRQRREVAVLAERHIVCCSSHFTHKGRI